MLLGVESQWKGTCLDISWWKPDGGSGLVSGDFSMADVEQLTMMVVKMVSHVPPETQAVCGLPADICNHSAASQGKPEKGRSLEISSQLA